MAAAQQGLNLAPDNPDAHFSYGYVLHEQNPAAAAEAYRAALELNPQHIEALNNLSSLSLQHGRWDEGVRGMANVLTGSPQAQLPLTVLDHGLGVALRRIHLLTFGSLWVFVFLSLLFRREGSPWLPMALLVVVFVVLLAWALSILRKHISPIRQQLPRRGERYLRQYARRDPLGAAWMVLLVLVWAGLTLGLLATLIVVGTEGLDGSDPPLFDAAAVGIFFLCGAVIVSWIRVPVLNRRIARQKFLD